MGLVVVLAVAAVGPRRTADQQIACIKRPLHQRPGKAIPETGAFLDQISYGRWNRFTGISLIPNTAVKERNSRSQLLRQSRLRVSEHPDVTQPVVSWVLISQGIAENTHQRNFYGTATRSPFGCSLDSSKESQQLSATDDGQVFHPHYGGSAGPAVSFWQMRRLAESIFQETTRAKKVQNKKNSPQPARRLLISAIHAVLNSEEAVTNHCYSKFFTVSLFHSVLSSMLWQGC